MQMFAEKRMMNASNRSLQTNINNDTERTSQ